MDKIRERIIRYVDEYGWNWFMVMKQINAYFGTALSAEQLRKLYKLSKAARVLTLAAFSFPAVQREYVYGLHVLRRHSLKHAAY